MDKNIVSRINFLAKKSMHGGLTPEEKEEQTRLRNEFREAVLGNMQAQLDSIRIQEADGSLTPLSKKEEK